MLFNHYHTMTTIQRLFLLRSIAIIIQLLTVLIVYFFMSLNIPLLPLLLVIIIESCFHLTSIYFYQKRNASNIALLCQIVADVIFLTILLSLSGGATNAFVSLLLLPIVIAAVSLPAQYLFFISLSAVASYSVLLLTLPEHTMHYTDMNNHFIGMWVNFLLSVVVVSFVVGTMARIIIQREQVLALQREEQLKNEQLLALGVASAQVTHQVATPLATIQLLYDELIEDFPKNEALQAMEKPLNQCIEQLGYFRTLATSLRENKAEYISPSHLIADFIDQAHFHFPEQEITLIEQTKTSDEILSDAMLIPALLNLLQNAIKANKQANQKKITLSVSIINDKLMIKLRDFGNGIEMLSNKENFNTLGKKIVKSKSGLGMAVFLSNTTFQRLGGELSLHNHTDRGCIAQVILPLHKIDATIKS